MNRDTWAASAATIAVIAGVVLGLLASGGPRTQRLVQSDLRTIQMIAGLAQQINFTTVNSGNILPANLEKFPGSLKQDPATGIPFIYPYKSNKEYELCATFATDNQKIQTRDASRFWNHPKGTYCFELNALQQISPAPFNY